MSNYCRGGHSKYSLKVHLIFVTKYRKKIFNYKNIDEDVKQFFYDVSIKYHYKIIQMETDKDHIHILLEYNPNDKISEIVKYLKQYTTYMIWNKYPLLFLGKLLTNVNEYDMIKKKRRKD